jgi:cytochrome P450
MHLVLGVLVSFLLDVSLVEGVLMLIWCVQGRHPCLGMRIAKLEIKLILVLIFAGYEWEIVDKEGKPPKHLPRPDKNDLQQVRVS